MYQGYANYATWVVSMTLDNERGSHEYYRKIAKDLQTGARQMQIKNKYWTEEETIRYNLAEVLKANLECDMVDETVARCPGCGRRFLHPLEGLQRTLMMSVLKDVDWIEVAQTFLEE